MERRLHAQASLCQTVTRNRYKPYSPMDTLSVGNSLMLQAEVCVMD